LFCHIRRRGEQHIAIEHREAGGVQGRCLGQESMAAMFALPALAAERADVAEHRLEITSRCLVAQPRARELRIEVARIDDEGLALGSEGGHKPGFGYIEQRAQDPAEGELADRWHPGETVAAAMSVTPQTKGFSLIFAMVAGHHVKPSLLVAPLFQKPIARGSRRLLNAGCGFFAVPDQDFVLDRTGGEPLPYSRNLGAALRSQPMVDRKRANLPVVLARPAIGKDRER
jgi:hypothetical protein